MSRKDTQRPGKLRENIESLVIAIALALIIRATVVEAFVVPTDSMAPTIYGTHLEKKCGNCGYVLDTNWDSGRWHLPDEIVCPVCGNSSNIHFWNYSSGDRLLVNKFVHKMQPLERWDIVVFKYPGNEPGKVGKNYIKRLAGLPGELLQIKNGDLFIDGEIARKPLHVQDDMWIDILHMDFEKDVWDDFWTPRHGNVLVENGVLKLGTDSAMFDFLRPRDALMFYNGVSGNAVTNPVRDMRIAFDVDLSEKGGFKVELFDLFTFVLSAGQNESSMSAGRGGNVWSEELGMEQGRHYAEFIHSDAALYMVVDGNVVGSFEYPPGTLQSQSSRISFGPVSGGAGVCSVDISRDVYYCSLGYGKDHGVASPFQLAREERDPDTGALISENEYFFLGDNSRASSDSRVWKQVKESLIRGKAVVRFWPPLRMGYIR